MSTFIDIITYSDEINAIALDLIKNPDVDWRVEVNTKRLADIHQKLKAASLLRLYGSEVYFVNDKLGYIQKGPSGHQFIREHEAFVSFESNSRVEMLKAIIQQLISAKMQVNIDDVPAEDELYPMHETWND